jgi:hypothetical protein
MSKIAFHRTLAGFVARSEIGLSRRGGADHGRQDKSAASGRAHVIGWIEDFLRLVHPTGWRFRAKRQRFQYSERHLGDQGRRPRA